MTELRFDGRVAVVTGAGRGIGRAYARLLAARGASVVVNDLGGGVDGTGADRGPAATAVSEITAAGGVAATDTNDVATVDGAGAVVETAIDTFGRIDIVINNAGMMRWAGIVDADAENLAAHLAVHVGGSFNTTRAAWPHLQAQGYGRVVMTTSTGIFGLPDNVSYATAKAAVIGMTRSLATAGRDHGIKVNLIAPAAATRMGGEGSAVEPHLKPDAVAPMAAYLAHEKCPVTGEAYVAGAGRFARLFLATTKGALVDGEPTIEDVADQWTTINHETGYSLPADLPAWSKAFMRHLPA